MKIAMFLLLCSLGRTYVVAGCPEPNVVEPPAWVDCNFVIGDLKAAYEFYASDEPFSCGMRACDPNLDNQGFKWDVNCQPLGLHWWADTNAADVYFGVPINTPGIFYVVISVADKPTIDLPITTDDDPKTTIGTVAIKVKALPVNIAPEFYPLQ